MTAGRLRRVVATTVIAAMLDGLRDTDGNERIAFKGGGALELRFGLRARASKDLDAAFKGELDDALDLVDAALAREWNGFTGRLGAQEDILRPGITPPPRRTTIRLSYKDRPFVTIPFEVSAAEGRSLDELERVVGAVSLEPVQLPGLERVALMPIRYQVAQKLHACTEALDGDSTNQRVHDLHDLLLIEELAVSDTDLPAVRAACVEIFASRNKQGWPPSITVWPDWPTLWARLVDTERLDRALDDAVAAVQAFVAAIDAASASRPSP